LELERYIVSPLRVETIVEEDGGKQTEVEGEAEIEMVKDLTGAEVSFVGIGTSEIEVEQVEGSFGQEVGGAGERFHVEELIFDEAVDGFDVGLVGAAAGRMGSC